MIDSQNFSLRIDRLVSETGLDYMDAIIHYCEENNMEVEAAAALCNDKIKELLEIQAGALNLLKSPRKVARLPV